MASANQAAQACCVRDGITLKRREMLASADVTPSAGTPATPINFQQFTCKLCLIDVENVAEATTLQQCGCQFCTEVSNKIPYFIPIPIVVQSIALIFYR